MNFDPYEEWLNIGPERRPPSYYDLLGLAAYESDPERIHAAGVERIANVRRFQLGQHGAEAIDLLGQLASAFDCLSTPERKAAYDERLRAAEKQPQTAASISAPARAAPEPLQTVAARVIHPSESDSPGSQTPLPEGPVPEEPGLEGQPPAAPRLPWAAAGALLGTAILGASFLAMRLAPAASGAGHSTPSAIQPRLTHATKISIQEEETFKTPIAVEDSPETSAPWKFQLQKGAPAGARIDADTGEFIWEPDEEQGPGNYRIGVLAECPGQPTLETELHIHVNEMNRPPRLEPIDDLTVDEEAPLEFVVRATDPDRPANQISFALESGAPEGMHLDSKTGRLWWTPSESQGPGEYLVRIRASDDASPPALDAKSFAITVREVNTPPRLAPLEDVEVELYDPATVKLAVRDHDLPANQFELSIVPPVPPGAAIDPVTQTFIWRPAPETYGTDQRVTVLVADDGEGKLSASRTFTIRVERVATNSIGMKLVFIQPGHFRFGWENPPDRNQQRAEEVAVKTPFYLGQYEVTLAEFEKYAEETGNLVDSQRDHLGGRSFNGTEFFLDQTSSWRRHNYQQGPLEPVVNISWNDAEQFCDWLTAREGRRYRLPTEKEWEYCCRAGTTGPYPEGDSEASLWRFANIADQVYARELDSGPSEQPFIKTPWRAAYWNDRYLFTAPVGTFAPNAWELYDMRGNVFEWCEDTFGGERIVRGGSFFSSPAGARAEQRYWHQKSYRRDDLGFRVVAEGGEPISAAALPPN